MNHRIVYWLAFVLLFSYVIMRAIWVNPLLDEVGTLYWYIQTGFLPGHGAVMDANNHVLNSIVSHWFYVLLGDDLFVIRLFSVLCFPLYFWSIIGIVKHYISDKFNVFLSLSIVSIPWILEYFAYSRGYGISLAFLFFAIYNFIKNNVQYTAIQQWSFILGLILGLGANLNLFVTVLILFAFNLATTYFNRSQMKRMSWWLSTTLFVIFCVPAIVYMRKLEKGGALWWGSENGYYNTTLGSLNKVFFLSHDTWISAFVVLIFLTLAFFYFLKKEHRVFKQLIFPMLFLGNCIGYFALNMLFSIHYPSDRLVMHLLPLFLLSVMVICKYSKVRWLFIPVFAWCIVSLALTLGLSTSIYSPEDRLSKEIESFIEKNNAKDVAISGDYVTCELYSFSQRRNSLKHLMMEYNGSNGQKGYYHLNWQNTTVPEDFQLKYIDRVTKMKIWENKRNALLIPIRSWRNNKVCTKDTLVLAEVEQSDYMPEMQIHFKGKLHCLEPNQNYSIQLVRKEGNALKCVASTRLNSYCGTKLKNYVTGNFMLNSNHSQPSKWSILLTSSNEKTVFWDGYISLVLVSPKNKLGSN